VKLGIGRRESKATQQPEFFDKKESIILFLIGSYESGFAIQSGLATIPDQTGRFPPLAFLLRNRSGEPPMPPGTLDALATSASVVWVSRTRSVSALAAYEPPIFVGDHRAKLDA